MSLSRSQLEAMNPSVLHILADQVGSVHSSLIEQLQAHEQVSRNIGEGWRGTAADKAGGDVDDHLTKMRSNAEGVAQLRTALSNAGNELTSARSNILNAVAQAESNGFRMGDDWSIQDVSGKKGMQRSAALREDTAQLRDSLTELGQAEQSAGRAMQAALDGIKPVDSRYRMNFFGGCPAHQGGGPNSWPPNCIPLDGSALSYTTPNGTSVELSYRNGQVTAQVTYTVEGQKYFGSTKPKNALPEGEISLGEGEAPAKLPDTKQYVNRSISLSGSSSFRVCRPPPTAAAVKPAVDNQTLSNVINSLYNTVDSPTRVGDGTSMDACRYERQYPGYCVGGRCHLQKAIDSLNSLNNLLKGGSLSPEDQRIALSIVQRFAALGIKATN